MSSNDRISDNNSLYHSAPFKRRFEFLSGKTSDLSWSLDDISSTLSTEQRSNLREALAQSTEFKFLKTTSVEQLQKQGQSKDPDRPYLGRMIQVQVPVTCLGSSVTDRNRPILEERGLPDDYPMHTRFMAHGLTWGVMYVKQRFGTNAAGKRFTAGLSTFVACNQCLDLYLGDLKDGRRDSSKWPKEWVRKENPNQKPVVRKGNKSRKKTDRKGKRTSKTLRATDHLISSINGKWSDPFRKVTLTMLTAVGKEHNFVLEGKKMDQLNYVLKELSKSEKLKDRISKAMAYSDI